MLLTEYDEVAVHELMKRDFIEEGREEGRLSAFVELVKEKILSISDAAKRLNIPESEFVKCMNAQTKK